MAWELDPDFALQSRLSFGRHAPMTVAMLVLLQSILLAIPSVRLEAGPVLAILALAAVAIAPPYGAAHVLSRERGGALDRQRLSGRTDAHLAFALLAGSGWALVFVAIPGATVAPSLGMGATPIAAIVTGGVATAVLMLATSRTSQMSPWVLLAFGVLVTGMTASIVSSYAATAALILAIELIGAMAALPAALRRFRRPPITIGTRPWNVLRHLASLPTTRVPEFSRALITAGADGGQSLLLLATVLILAAAIGWVPPAQREIVMISIVYVPLFVAAVQCSASARVEDVNLLRLSGRSGAGVAVQLGAGFAASYLIVSAVAAMSVLALHRPDGVEVVRYWPIIAVLVVFAGIAEGLARRRAGVYLATVVPLLLVAPRGWRETAIVAGAGLWIPIAFATGRLADAKAAPLSGAAAIAASAAVGVIAVIYHLHSTWPFAFIAVAMSIGAGMLVPEEQPGGTARQRAVCAAAAAVGAGVAGFFLLGTERSWSGSVAWPHVWLPQPTFAQSTMFAGIYGLNAAIGLQFGWLVHNLFGSSTVLSRAARALPMCGVALLMLLMNLSVSASARPHFPGMARDWAPFVRADVALLAVLAICVGVLTVVERRRGLHSRRRRARTES